MRPEKPGIGKTIVGVAVAALATGPTVVALSWLAGMLLDQWPLGPMNDGGVLPFMVIASLFGLIGSLPAACVNAVVLSLAARNDEDAAWLSAISGAVIAMLVAVLMAAAYGYPIAQFFLDPPPQAAVHRLSGG